MTPSETLSKEHKLIERMIRYIEWELKKAEETNKFNFTFLDFVRDFFETYADRNHHGKEEKILFREFAKKQIFPEDQGTVTELINDHNHFRENVGKYVRLKQRYSTGENQALPELIALLKHMSEFYLAHMRKEENHFFAKMQKYFLPAELEEMTKEFATFDLNKIHQRFETIISQLEKNI